LTAVGRLAARVSSAGRSVSRERDQNGQNALAGQHQHQDAGGQQHQRQGVAHQPEAPAQRAPVMERPAGGVEVILGHAHQQPGNRQHRRHGHHHAGGGENRQQRLELLEQGLPVALEVQIQRRCLSVGGVAVVFMGC
jgi:hypothetical protein